MTENATPEPATLPAASVSIDLATADRDESGCLDGAFLLRETRRLIETVGGRCVFTEFQFRNYRAADALRVDCRLNLLADRAADRLWRVSFLSPDNGTLLAETMATEHKPDGIAPAKVKPTVVAKPAVEQGTGDPRWQRLFEAACDVIDRKGYGAASMREIAKAAGLPIATMYQHIGAKEDLLFMITKGCMEQLFETFEQDFGRSGAAEDDLRGAIAAYVDYIGRNRKYINLVYRETRSLSPENRERIFEIERAFAAKWQRILDDGVASSQLRCADTAFTAHALYFLCTIWALRYWAIDGYGAEEVKSQLTALVLDGLKAQ